MSTLPLKINDTVIDDTFAEAFSMQYTRIVVTAINQHWLTIAINQFCGYGTSVIGCDAEVGVETWLPAEQTPDRRPGASVLAFGFSTDALSKAVANRTGQCLMTCPTVAVFNGLEIKSSDDKKIELGTHLRYFGDGFQKSKLLGKQRFWRIPVMDGEFIVEDAIGVAKGVAGGNLLIQSRDQITGLHAASAAVDAIQKISGVITPFPGGIARSGSKVGSRYPSLRASTAHFYCPTLRGRVETQLHDEVNCVYEIVIDGIDFGAVATAMKTGIQFAANPEIIAISAGNYGGKLGKHHFYLRELLVS